MNGFCVVEGVDGSGKSHLVRAVRDHVVGGRSHPPEISAVPSPPSPPGGSAPAAGLSRVTALLKDDLAVSDGSWTGDRLAAMHALTWSYQEDEPVWDYSRRYWLHTLCAWFELVHQAVVAPAAATGVVLMDGWHLKHLARFSLSDDTALIQEATAAFGALPQPDLVIVLDTPTDHITNRKTTSKPSERGAFDNPADSAGAGSGGVAGGVGSRTPLAQFAGYQGRTAAALEKLLAGRSGVARLPGSHADPAAVLALMARRLDPAPAATDQSRPGPGQRR